jgi:hypothetical protein
MKLSGKSGGPFLSPHRGAQTLTAYDNAGRDITMFANPKFWSALVVLICIAVGSMTNSASAVTVEVAKKCQALSAKAYPPRVIGNPAAGSAKGTGQSERDYYNKCVANGGNIDDQAPKEAK